MGNTIQWANCEAASRGATLQMFAGIYRDFAGKSESGDFKFTGIACIPAILVIFEVNLKKVWTFYICMHFIKIFQISFWQKVDFLISNAR